MPNTASGSEGLVNAPFGFDEVLIALVKTLDGVDEARRNLEMFKYLPHEVVRKAGEGSLEVKEDESSIFISEAELHGSVFNIKNVGHHASAREEASL